MHVFSTFYLLLFIAEYYLTQSSIIKEWWKLPLYFHIQRDFLIWDYTQGPRNLARESVQELWRAPVLFGDSHGNIGVLTQEAATIYKPQVPIFSLLRHTWFIDFTRDGEQFQSVRIQHSHQQAVFGGIYAPEKKGNIPKQQL